MLVSISRLRFVIVLFSPANVLAVHCGLGAVLEPWGTERDMTVCILGVLRRPG